LQNGTDIVQPTSVSRILNAAGKRKDQSGQKPFFLIATTTGAQRRSVDVWVRDRARCLLTLSVHGGGVALGRRRHRRHLGAVVTRSATLLVLYV